MIPWLALMAATAAAASPVDELAFDLGRAHALRQLCVGRTDGQWRDRMADLLTAEGATGARKQALTVRFNAGFADGRAAFPTCDERAQAALRETAGKGATLARTLARAPPTAATPATPATP